MRLAFAFALEVLDRSCDGLLMDDGTIFVDAKGRPFERPTKPAPGADIETVIAYVRAVHEYNTRCRSCGNLASKAIR